MNGLSAFAVGRQAAGAVQRRQRGAALPVRSEISYIMVRPPARVYPVKGDENALSVVSKPRCAKLLLGTLCCVVGNTG